MWLGVVVLTLMWCLCARLASCAVIEEIRYVRIGMAAASRITLCEVEVYDEAGANVALGRPARQSTYMGNTKASPAVDGNRNPSWWAGSCTHTEDVDLLNQFWEVDLETVRNISKIDIYNRKDCCDHRLEDHYVMLLGANHSLRWYSTPLGRQLFQSVDLSNGKFAEGPALFYPDRMDAEEASTICQNHSSYGAYSLNETHNSDLVKLFSRFNTDVHIGAHSVADEEVGTTYKWEYPMQGRRFYVNGSCSTFCKWGVNEPFRENVILRSSGVWGTISDVTTAYGVLCVPYERKPSYSVSLSISALHTDSQSPITSNSLTAVSSASASQSIPLSRSISIAPTRSETQILTATMTTTVSPPPTPTRTFLASASATHSESTSLSVTASRSTSATVTVTVTPPPTPSRSFGASTTYTSTPSISISKESFSATTSIAETQSTSHIVSTSGSLPLTASHSSIASGSGILSASWTVSASLSKQLIIPVIRIVSRPVSEQAVARGAVDGSHQIISFQVTGTTWNCTSVTPLMFHTAVIIDHKPNRSDEATNLEAKFDTWFPMTRRNWIACTQSTLSIIFPEDRSFQIDQAENISVLFPIKNVLVNHPQETNLDLVEQPPPAHIVNDHPRSVVTISKELTATVEVAGEIGSTVSVAAANPAIAMQARRSSLLLTLAECDDNTEDLPLDFMTSPTGVALSHEHYRLELYAGAVLMNPIVLLGTSAVHVLLAFVYAKVRRLSLGDGFGALKFPGFQFAVFMLLLQPTTMCATTLLRQSSTPESHFLSIVVLLLIVGFILMLTLELCSSRRFAAQCVLREEKVLKNQSCIGRAFVGDTEWRNIPEFCRCPTKLPRTYDSSLLGWHDDPKQEGGLTRQWIDPADDDATSYKSSTGKKSKRRGLFFNYVGCFGLVFDLYKQDRQWFCVVELVATVFLGVCEGWRPRSPAGCTVLINLMTLVVLAFFVLLIVFRPFATWFEVVGAFGIAVMQLFAAIALWAFHTVNSQPIWVNVSVIATMSGLLFVTMKAIADLLLLFAECRIWVRVCCCRRKVARSKKHSNADDDDGGGVVDVDDKTELLAVAMLEGSPSKPQPTVHADGGLLPSPQSSSGGVVPSNQNEIKAIDTAVRRAEMIPKGDSRVLMLREGEMMNGPDGAVEAQRRIVGNPLMLHPKREAPTDANSKGLDAHLNPEDVEGKQRRLLSHFFAPIKKFPSPEMNGNSSLLLDTPKPAAANLLNDQRDSHQSTAPAAVVAGGNSAITSQHKKVTKEEEEGSLPPPRPIFSSSIGETHMSVFRTTTATRLLDGQQPRRPRPEGGGVQEQRIVGSPLRPHPKREARADAHPRAAEDVEWKPRRLLSHFFSPIREKSPSPKIPPRDIQSSTAAVVVGGNSATTSQHKVTKEEEGSLPPPRPIFSSSISETHMSIFRTTTASRLLDGQHQVRQPGGSSALHRLGIVLPPDDISIVGWNHRSREGNANAAKVHSADPPMHKAGKKK